MHRRMKLLLLLLRLKVYVGSWKELASAKRTIFVIPSCVHCSARYLTLFLRRILYKFLIFTIYPDVMNSNI